MAPEIGLWTARCRLGLHSCRVKYALRHCIRGEQTVPVKQRERRLLDKPLATSPATSWIRNPKTSSSPVPKASTARRATSTSTLACTNRCPNADRCLLRNFAIARYAGAWPPASHRNATLSQHASSNVREDRTPVV